MTVSILFQLPIKFHFWHFKIQTLYLNLISAPICKHSAANVNVNKSNIQAMSIYTTVPFIVASITADLSHRKPVSAGTSRERYCAQGHTKRDILYFSIKWKLGDWLVWWDCVLTVIGSNPTEVTTVCEVMLFVCHELCMLSLPATLQTMLKLCVTFRWSLSQIPNKRCVMHDVSVSDAGFWGSAAISNWNPCQKQKWTVTVQSVPACHILNGHTTN